MAQVPIAEGLLTGLPDEPTLWGSRCRECGAVIFPTQGSCPRCTAEMMDEVPLERHGTLWTWTTQEFPPGAPPYAVPPEAFEPFVLGYVELPGQLRVQARLAAVDVDQLAIGMAMEAAVITLYTNDDGDDVVIPAFPAPALTQETSMDIAIVGIGLFPFGRHDGVSALEMGHVAARRAMADAGVGWADMQFAVGGSSPWDSGFADTLVSRLGLTGAPFMNVYNGCATAGTTLTTARDAIRSGEYDLGLAVGFDKHPRGAFTPDPSFLGLPAWYGEAGYMVTPQFFGMKLNRYLHDYGISGATLARVAAKAYRNGAQNPNAWRRKPLSEAEISASPMLNRPLTHYMFCSPSEGGAALVLCRADLAHRYTSTPVYLRAVTLRTRRFGSIEVFSPSTALDPCPSPTVDAAAACFEAAGIGPGDVDLAQVQDTEAGSEIIHMAETGLCGHGDQEALVAAGATKIGGRLPINTDGGLIANGEPIGASGMRQVYETVLQLRGDAGERQVPGDPRVGFTHVYGAPGVSCCTLLTR